MNPLIRIILRSPLHFLLDGNLIAISYTGRRSGRRFSLVTMYAEFGKELLVIVAQPEKKKWWRNFHEKASADVLFKGQRFTCVAQVPERDRAGNVPRLEAYFSRHPFSARISKVRREKDGKLNSEDVARAAESVIMVVFELSPGLGGSSLARGPARALASSRRFTPRSSVEKRCTGWPDPSLRGPEEGATPRRG